MIGHNHVLLKILQEYSTYSEYLPYIKTNAFSQEEKNILDSYAVYFDKHDNQFDFNQYETWFFQVYNQELSQQQCTSYRLLFEVINNAKTDQVLSEVIKEFHTQKVAHDLAKLCISGFDVDKAKAMLEGLDDEVSSEAEQINLDELAPFVPSSELYESEDNTVGLSLGLQCMDNSIGMLGYGLIGFIFAYPNTGKSALAIFFATQLAKQLQGEDQVGYFSNEQKRSIMDQRIRSCVLGKTIETLRNSDKDLVDRRYAEALNNDSTRIRLFDCRDKPLHYIENIIKNSPNLKVIIIDMVHKIRYGEKADAKHTIIESLVIELKTIAQKYNRLIIGTLQADASTTQINWKDQEAEFIRYPAMHQIKDTKIGVQGEADFLIGIGKDKMTLDYARYLSTPKNKLAVLAHQIEEIKAEVKFDRFKSLFED